MGATRDWCVPAAHAIVGAMQRRGLLTLGLVSAAALAAGGGTLALLQPAWRDGKLSERAREVMAAVSRAVLDGTLPADTTVAASELDALLRRVDTAVAGLPPHAQAELGQLLALLASVPGRLTLAGLRTQWQQASVAQVQDALQAMRLSRLTLRQQAYQALRELVGSAYFAEPGTWPALGYPGPVKI